MRLNLGCGKDIKKNYINCDARKVKGVNKIVNLDKKLPFKNNTCDEIIAYKIIEHLNNPIQFIEECYRISKPKAIIKILAPHTSNLQLAGCLDHKRLGINYQSFNMFLETNRWNYYSKTRLKIKYYEYQLNPIISKKGFWSWYRKKIAKRYLKQIQYLLKKNPRFTELYISKWFNLGRFYIELEVIK